MVLGCINRTAWGTKLFLTADWTSLVDCNSLCHLLKAQHCLLSPNGCFNPPLAPQRPYHPPHPLKSMILQELKKPSQKLAAFK